MRGSNFILTIALLLGGCAVNPWPEAYTALTPTPPVARSELLLVDFDEATRERAEDGHEIIGYASFTGEYSRAIERSLREFAQERGATLVAWGAKHLHNEVTTDLRPVFETYTSRRHDRVYDAHEGRYVRERRPVTTTATRYVPVVEEDAIYAYRAVFYRPR